MTVTWQVHELDEKESELARVGDELQQSQITAEGRQTRVGLLERQLAELRAELQGVQAKLAMAEVAERTLREGELKRLQDAVDLSESEARRYGSRYGSRYRSGYRREPNRCVYHGSCGHAVWWTPIILSPLPCRCACCG